MTGVVRWFGWLLLSSGAVVLLYVAYLLWFTGLETSRAQAELAGNWSVAVLDRSDTPVEGTSSSVEGAPEPVGPIELGDLYAALWFERGGIRILHLDPLYVLEGATLSQLRAGPVHYPESDRPGGAGNLAIAGHRSTYGSPFWAIDELIEGDTIHVMDRQGREWVYAYQEQRVVEPTDVWVIGEDPRATGVPTITLTTCHPRGSAQLRLIVWGELVGDPIDPEADSIVPDKRSGM
jgi:sortase A